jgi:hypothetical protein
MHPITRLSCIGLAAAACVATSLATAGQSDLEGVQIYKSASYNYIEGAMAGARFSRDTSQNIGCSTQAFQGGGQLAECYATDANGVQAWCVTTDPSLVAVAGRVTSTSVIIAQWYATGANCEFISVDANSKDTL